MFETFLVFCDVKLHRSKCIPCLQLFPHPGLLLQGFLKFKYEYESAINLITIKARICGITSYHFHTDCISLQYWWSTDVNQNFPRQVEKNADGPLQYNFCMTGDLGAIWSRKKSLQQIEEFTLVSGYEFTWGISDTCFHLLVQMSHLGHTFKILRALFTHTIKNC